MSSRYITTITTMNEMVDFHEARYYEAHLKDGTFMCVEFPEPNNVTKEEKLLGFECYECYEDDTNIRYVYYCDRLEGCQFMKTTMEDGSTITLNISGIIC